MRQSGRIRHYQPENVGFSRGIDGVWAPAADVARRTPGGQGEGQTLLVLLVFSKIKIKKQP